MKFKEQSRIDIKARTKKIAALGLSAGVIITAYTVAYIGAKEGAAAGLKTGSLDIRLFSTDSEGNDKLIPKKN